MDTIHFPASRRVRMAAALVAATLALLAALPAQAQSAADFYKGKTVTIIVSSGGGSYNLIAQTILAGHGCVVRTARPTASMRWSGH